MFFKQNMHILKHKTIDNHQKKLTSYPQKNKQLIVGILLKYFVQETKIWDSRKQ